MRTWPKDMMKLGERYLHMSDASSLLIIPPRWKAPGGFDRLADRRPKPARRRSKPDGWRWQ